MACRTNRITPEIKQWLLKSAWKKHTLKEIALLSNINVVILNRLYDEYDIKPITKRDRIASKILDLYNSGAPFPKNSELALMFDCSGPLIKSILDDFGLNSATKAYKKALEKANAQKDEKLLAALEDFDKRTAAQKELRKTFTSYTQSSSDLLDQCRQTHTTLRPNTYLTNNG